MRYTSPMAKRDDVIAAANELLGCASFRDSCPNGLQVYGRESVSRLMTCASVSEELFRQAALRKAELVLVHHGLFWDRDSRVVDPILGRRLRLLLDAQVSLAAYHLPLDAHPEVGNNACLARLLGLTDVRFDFGHYHGTAIGCLGTLNPASPAGSLSERLALGLGFNPLRFGESEEPVSRIGVVSGGAGDLPMLLETKERGAQVLITGVLSEPGFAAARELSLQVIAAGHYASEKLGVRALGDWLARRFSLEVEHLDLPNPL